MQRLLDYLPVRRVQQPHRPPLRLHSDMAVMLQHLAAQVTADCLNRNVGGLRLCQSRNEMVPQIVNSALDRGLSLRSAPCPLPRSKRLDL